MEKIAYLSDRLKSELENKGLSAADLCRLTGIDTSIMSKYIRGIKHPKIERLRRIAAVLYVTPEWLEGYDVPKTPAPVQLSPLENDIIINFRACNDAEKFAIIEFVKKIRG
ncbi:MAG: helix-turn-helix domain-containing protein [Bacteroidales bacterium]|nr:helix-turn-helix domain-containing protein [Bacteroidales bacterium]